jgi:hypothetical protein
VRDRRPRDARLARVGIGCARRRSEGFRLSDGRARDTEVRGPGRAGDSKAVTGAEPRLDSAGPRATPSSESAARAARRCASPEREARRQTRRGEKRRPASGRVTTTRVSLPVRRSVAEVVGPLSGSEKRAIGIVRVESPGGAPDARGREPSLGEVGARERAGSTLTKGRAVPRRQSDPHHVSARHSREAAWLAYVLRRVRGVHAALGDGRCLGSAKRAHLSRGSAWKRPRRPPEQTSIGDRSPRAPGEATEMPRALSHRARGRTNNPHAISIGSPSGLRVVKRAFPRSRSHRRAPSPSVNALPSSDGRESRV